MHSVWASIPFIALLTVEGNEKREADFFQDACRLGLTPDQVRVYRFRKGQFGMDSVDAEIARGHQLAHRDALQVGAAHALIFEDDSRFFADVDAADVQRALRWMQQNWHRWELFFLGCVHNAPPIPVARNVDWTLAPLLSHAYVIKRGLMQETQALGFPSFRSGLDHIDTWFARKSGQKFAAVPQLCYQNELPRGFPFKDVQDFGAYQRNSGQFVLLGLFALVLGGAFFFRR